MGYVEAVINNFIVPFTAVISFLQSIPVIFKITCGNCEYTDVEKFN